MEKSPKETTDEFSMTEAPEKPLTGISIEKPSASIRQELYESQLSIGKRISKLYENYNEVLNIIDRLSETKTSHTAAKECLDGIFMTAKEELEFVVSYRSRLQEPLSLSSATVRLLDEQFATQERRARWLMNEIRYLLEKPTPLNQEISADERDSKKTDGQEPSRVRPAA